MVFREIILSLLILQSFSSSISKPKDAVPDNSILFTDEDIAEIERLNKLYGPIEMLEKRKSPLDENPSKAQQPISSMKQAFRGRMTDNIKMLSVCQQHCSKGLKETFDAMIESMSHVERYQRICKNYNESAICINLDKKCGDEDNSMFEVITSGLRYMCVDQVFAFNATIDCIDKQSTIVQGECENLCHTKNVIMNWIMRSSVAQSIQNGISAGLTDGMAVGDSGLGGVLGGLQIPQEGDSSFINNMKLLGKDMCSTGTCVLDCVRSKFNARCEGSAGTLLSEVLVRPIASTQEKMSIMSPLMGMFFPEECNFLYSGNDLSKHRIDPTLNEELRRMYIKKEVERTKKVEASKNKTELPSFNLPNYQKSPFDGETDFIALIDQVYGSKELTLANQVLQKAMGDEDSVESKSHKSKKEHKSSTKKAINVKEKGSKQDHSGMEDDTLEYQPEEESSGQSSAEEASGIFFISEDGSGIESSGLQALNEEGSGEFEGSGEKLKEKVFFARAIVGEQVSFIYNAHEDGKLCCKLMN
ncbi:unnamed protein product [Auanema sp. JU1783]|nr:unnamed protein product [Auanema sp. JU1783]